MVGLYLMEQMDALIIVQSTQDGFVMKLMDKFQAVAQNAETEFL